MLALTHMGEVSSESIPQAVFQFAVLASMDAEDREWIQYLSLLASLLTTAYVSAASGEEEACTCMPHPLCTRSLVTLTRAPCKYMYQTGTSIRLQMPSSSTRHSRVTIRCMRSPRCS